MMCGWSVALFAACSASGTAQPTDPSLTPLSSPAPTVATTVATEPETSAAAPTNPPGTPVDTTAATTDPPTTDSLPTSTDTTPGTTGIPVTTDPGLTGPMFSDALGTKVDTAPGVNTPGDTRELMPGLWVHIAWAPDPNDPSVFTVQPGDEEILEAYANAQRTYFEATTSNLDFSSEGWELYYEDGGAGYQRTFSERKARGERRDMAEGIVSRPYVLADLQTPDSAVVADCELDGSVWRTAEGDVAPGSIEGIVRMGLVAEMVKVNGAWLLASLGDDPGACV